MPTNDSDTPKGVHAPFEKAINALFATPTGDLDLILEEIVSSAQTLTDATYAALSVVGSDRRILRFVTRGEPVDMAESVGRLPTGDGVLGVLISDPRPLRLDDVSTHSASVGFPEGHVAMRSFLGVPIKDETTVYGNLYLTDKKSGMFTAEDEARVVTLSNIAAAAIVRARATAAARRRKELLELVPDAAEDVLSDADGKDIVRKICTRAIAILGADGGAVRLPALSRDDTLEIAPSFSGIQEYVRAIVAATALDPRNLGTRGVVTRSFELPAAAGGVEIAAIAGPLIADGRAIGGVSAFRVGRGGFDSDELDTLDEISKAAAVLASIYKSRENDAVGHGKVGRASVKIDTYDRSIQNLFALHIRLQTGLASDLDPDGASRLIESLIDDVSDAIELLRSALE